MVLVGLYFVIPRGEPSPIIRAGLIERYKPGTVTYFEDRHVFLVRRTDGGLLALSDSAQHFEGKTVEWLPDFEFQGIRGWFRSPAHAETFAMDGTLAFGPAARDMDRFQVFVCEGQVTIETTKVIDPHGLGSIPCGIE
jgi:nitrite reductase/ring-hydroxylating ferredoxin subunit